MSRQDGAGRSPVRQSVSLPPGVARDLLPLTAEDGAAIDAVLYARRRPAPRTALVLMHPTVSFHHHYAAIPLAKRGFAVLCCNSRFAGSEANLLMEQAVLDLAAGVRDLRERGVERVVLIGNSGGGALAALYQAEAERATVRSTPAGRPPAGPARPPRGGRGRRPGANLARVGVPLLVVQGMADQAIFPSDVRALFEAARVEDRQLHWIPHGSHYFRGQPEHQRLVFDLLERWLGERGMGARR